MTFKESSTKPTRSSASGDVPNNTTGRSDTMLIFMLTTGVICWALAGILAIAPAGQFDLFMVFAALGNISSEFTKTFSIGIFAASLAMLGLTFSALSLSKQTKNEFLPYEYRKNLRNLAQGFCWFNTSMLAFAIACSLVSMTNSNYALELLSKSLDYGLVTSSEQTATFTMQAGISFLWIMILFFLLLLNDMAEKAAVSLLNPHRAETAKAELIARAEEINQLSEKSKSLQERLLSTRAHRRLAPTLVWFFATAVIVCSVAGMIATITSRISRFASGDEPFSNFWSAASAATLLALFQYYISGLLAAPIKSKRWQKIANQSLTANPRNGRIGALIRTAGFVAVPLLLQALLFYSGDYSNHAFQALCLFAATWLIPNALALSNFSKGTVNSLMACKAVDDLESKIRALSSIQEEEQQAHLKETVIPQPVGSPIADDNGTESKLVIQLGSLGISISRTRKRGSE